MKRLVALLFLGTLAHAQYGRIDFFQTTSQGQAVSGAKISVYAQSACGSPAGALATLYPTATGGTPITNPMTTNGLGHAVGYVAYGCVTIVSSSTYTGTQTYPDWAVPNPSGGGGGGGGSTPGGSPTDVQYYDPSIVTPTLGGDVGLTYVKTPAPAVTIGGPLAPTTNTVTVGPQSAVPTSWKLDLTSPATACTSINCIAQQTLTYQGTNLEDTLTGWKPVCILPSCNPGGVDIPASTTQEIVTIPSLDGVSMHFQSVTNATSTQTNVLWTNHATNTCDGCTDMYPDFWFYAASNGSNASSFEFDSAIFSKSEGWDFMFGTQCWQAGGFWQIDNQSDPWQTVPGFVCSLTYNTWHHYQAHFYRIEGDTSCAGGNPCEHFDYIILDGVKHVINMTMRATVLNPTFASSTIQQFQIDIGSTSGSAKTVDEYIDEVNLTVSGPLNYMPLAGGNFLGPVTSGSTWNNLDLFENLSTTTSNLGGLIPDAATGIQNLAVGNGTMNGLTTGASNLALSPGALYNCTTCSSNVAGGVNSLNLNITGNTNSGWGVGSLNKTTAGANTGIGNNACGDNTTGTGNVCVGASSGVNATLNATGVGNVYVGQNANSAGDYTDVIVIGHNAQAPASHNAVIGTNSITTTTLNGNVVAPTFNSANIFALPGVSALNLGAGIPLGVTGINNSCAGSGACHLITSGHDNSASALNALAACTTCFSNVANGVGSLTALTTANANTGIGKSAASQLTTGSQVTAVGLGAGMNSGTPMTTTANSVFVGVNALDTVDALTNSNVFGFNAQGSVSNEVMLGNGSVTQLCWANESECWQRGSGAPSGGACVSGNIGSIYSNTNSAPANSIYVCTAAGVWSPVDTFLTGSGTLTYTAIAANACQEQPLTVTGAVTSNVCAASPQADPGANFQYGGCRVSASNTVQVRVCSGAGGTPTAVTWNARIQK